MVLTGDLRPQLGALSGTVGELEEAETELYPRQDRIISRSSRKASTPSFFYITASIPDRPKLSKRPRVATMSTPLEEVNGARPVGQGQRT